MSRLPPSNKSSIHFTACCCLAQSDTNTLFGRIGLGNSPLQRVQVRSLSTPSGPSKDSTKEAASEQPQKEEPGHSYGIFRRSWDLSHSAHVRNEEDKMSWGFGNAPQQGGSGSGVQTTAANDLGDVETEHLGFMGVGGDTKIRLLPTPWPSDKLPPNTASLLSIASQKGILAAAGPDTLVIASTESVRQRYNTKADDDDDSNIRNLKPEATIQVPRVNQVAFSSDESCLVIAAEEGGGLAVYETQTLLNGGKEPAFQIGTNGTAVRQMLPNPDKSNSHYFGIVLASGQLLLADLKERKLVDNQGGSPVLREGVSCACWSKLGKQIVAGLGDGSAVQVDPKGGVEKAQIPAPPQLQQSRDPATLEMPVTSIYWLETYDFLMIHSPINPPPGDSMGPPIDSVYTFVHRDKASGTCTYNKLSVDPCVAFLDRIPNHHFINRLNAWPPALDDMLVLACTGSTDVGLLSRSSQALNPDRNAAEITGTWLTTMPSETRRITLPISVSDGMSDTSPIGMALDLSTKEKVDTPIPGADDVDATATPVPALCVLNTEGILSTYWVIYNASVREKTMFPSLIAASGGQQQSQPQAQQTPVSQPQQSAFGQSAFGASTTPAAAPAFGSSSTPAAAPAFGQPAFGAQKPAAPAFGSSTPMGQPPTPAFGQSAFGTKPAAPAFGKPSAPAFGQTSGFGQTGGMGQKASPWGAPPQSPAPTGGATFGQASTPFGGNAGAASPFMSIGNTKPEEQRPGSSGGFSAFANKGGFGNLGGKENQASPFGQQKPPSVSAEPSFGSTVTLPSNTGSSFGSGGTFGGSAFGAPAQPQNGVGLFGKPSQSREETMEEDTPTQKPSEEKKAGSGLFGMGDGGFKLGSTFQGDGSAKDDGPKPKDPGASLFGSGFGRALNDTAKQQPVTPIKKEPGTDEPKLSEIPEVSTTPASPPKKAEDPADAPLPPDFTKIKMKTEPVPDFLVGKPKPEEPKPAEPKIADQPIAGSPPIDVGDERFSETASSPAGADEALPEDEDEDWSEEEGSADDQTQGEQTQEIPSTTPPTTKKDSFTPAGFPKATGPAAFAPPVQQQESPRSPSPVRAGQRQKSPLRAVTSPVRPTFGQRPNSSFAPQGGFTPHGTQQQAPRQPPTPAQKSIVPPAQPVSRAYSQQKQQPPATPQYDELEDPDHDRIQEILGEELEPTKELEGFVAHQDYAGRTDKTGVAGEIEKVYRDVNSMIDTLGLNARALQAFVDGHSDRQRDTERERDDLEEEEDWCLDEVEDLAVIQGNLEEDLEAARLEDVKAKMEGLREEENGMLRLKTKAAEVRKQIAQRADPQQRAAQHNSPLAAESAAQQTELRQSVQRVQTLLAEAEERMSLLRADLASLPSSDSSKSAPTVEAITRTILAMTAMAERKSGDIDVLESQIKRLPNGVASLNLNLDYEDDLVGAMRGSKLLNGSSSSPYAAPAASRSRMTAIGDPLGMSGMFGSKLRTPPNGRRSLVFSPSASALGRSTASFSSGSARKKMVDVTDVDVQRYNERVVRRRKVLGALKDAVEEKGVRVVRV